MTRATSDEIRGGRVYNGFDYRLQVWVADGRVEPCGHPEEMRAGGRACCNAAAYAGQEISEIAGAETFPSTVTFRA